MVGPSGSGASSSRLELYWLPLGAGSSVGSHVVRVCGGAYEQLVAGVQRRSAQPLFHCALMAHTVQGPCVVELTPVPAHGSPEQRGVIGGGAVGSRLLGHSRIFRYEIRRWFGGSIPDVDYAVDSPILITADDGEVQHVLDVVMHAPTLVWGRDHARTGDMWNSNSVVSWALTHAGLVERAGTPPTGGRAPGWDAGMAVALRGPRPWQPFGPVIASGLRR